MTPSPESALANGHAERFAASAGRERDRGRGAKPAPPALVPIDPRRWTSPAPPRRWIVQDWLPRGVVTALYGDGGVGKSLLAMQLLASTALGTPWLGLEVARCASLGVFCEDDAEELQRRQEAINAFNGSGMEDLGDLRLLSRLGEENALITFADSDIGMPTPFVVQLSNLIAAQRPGLVVLDTAADLFPASENDRSKVRQFIGGTLGKIARDHDCAVLLCAHPSMSGIATGTGAGGSTAWNNTVRSRWYLTRPEEEGASANARVLTRKKANYAPRDAEIPMAWQDGVFHLASADPAISSDIQWPTIDALFDELDRAWREGKPWSNAPQTKRDGRYFPTWAKQHHRVSEPRMKTLLGEWQMNGFLASEVFDKDNKARGLRVVRRLIP